MTTRCVAAPRIRKGPDERGAIPGDRVEQFPLPNLDRIFKDIKESWCCPLVVMKYAEP